MDYYVRPVNLNDIDAIYEIYYYYVMNTAITFEITMPTKDEFRQRVKLIQKEYPYFVIEHDGSILG